MNVFKKIGVSLVVSGFAAAGISFAVPDGADLAQRHSCGYHCVPGGSATPAAPSVSADVQLVGRTNVHSGGRAGGMARPRRGSNSPGERTSGWH